jgi:long-subunit acyl-CoA synthetase (AMP-forming)
MISHRAVLSTIAGLVAYLEQLGEKMNHNDVFLSFLPLAHIFDRCVRCMLSYMTSSLWSRFEIQGCLLFQEKCRIAEIHSYLQTSCYVLNIHFTS